MDKKKKISKKPSECYIYANFPGYTKKILDAIKNAKRINKNSKEFVEDVALEIKRSKAPAYLLKVLDSSNTVLYTPEHPMPRVIRVVCAKDFKEKNHSIKAFIDTSSIITQNASTNRFNVQSDVLIAYLISAKTNMVYTKLPNSYTSKSSYMVMAAKIYGKLMAHLVDYLGNISVIPNNRDRMMFYGAKFFLVNILRLEDEDRINAIASKACDLKPTETSVFDILTEYDDFTNLRALLELIKKSFKLDKLTLNLLIEKWMYLYGPGTVLGMEFLPSFITIITDAYLGVYLNNQKSIEKVVGSKDLISFGKDNIYSMTI